jgi:hypothetical protein
LKIDYKLTTSLIRLAGVYNIGGHLEHETYRGVEKISAMARAMGSNQESFKKNSPINIIRENKDMFEHSSALISHMPRILFIHGEKDAVVPVQQSIDMYNALGEVLPPEKRDDVDVRMRLYKKMGHAECVTGKSCLNLFYECTAVLTPCTISSYAKLDGKEPFPQISCSRYTRVH